MLEYELQEAKDLLTKNRESANGNLQVLNEDLDFLSEQIVTLEVSILSIFSILFLFFFSFLSSFSFFFFLSFSFPFPFLCSIFLLHLP